MIDVYWERINVLGSCVVSAPKSNQHCSDCEWRRINQSSLAVDCASLSIYECSFVGQRLWWRVPTVQCLPSVQHPSQKRPLPADRKFIVIYRWKRYTQLFLRPSVRPLESLGLVNWMRTRRTHSMPNMWSILCTRLEISDCESLIWALGRQMDTATHIAVRQSDKNQNQNCIWRKLTEWMRCQFNVMNLLNR